MIHRETLDALVRPAAMSADNVAIGFDGTEAAKTRAVIERALECLEANGLITVTPTDEWPEWIVMNPPWQDVFG